MRLGGVILFVDELAVIIQSKSLGALALVSPSTLSAAVSATARLSHLCESSLHMLSFYETSELDIDAGWHQANALLHVYSTNCNFFSSLTRVVNSTISSSESLFFSLLWQERECAEMLGVFFSNKSDRRSSFLPHMRNLAPLRKSTPTGGFFELSMDYLFERSTWSRLA